MVITTGAGGSTSAQLASFLPVSHTQSDSEPTSTMDVAPAGLLIEEASNSLWTTNTWITTNALGESEPTVVPVLLPEIITDPPEQGDVEQSDPQDENEDPDTNNEEKNPYDETKSDDKQTSTSEMSEVSTSTPSSSEPFQ
ncbi:MAG: hypothetical protein Q9198_007874, partial [Flavoplaca austrocitrina]